MVQHLLTEIFEGSVEGDRPRRRPQAILQQVVSSLQGDVYDQLHHTTVGVPVTASADIHRIRNSSPVTARYGPQSGWTTHSIQQVVTHIFVREAVVDDLGRIHL